MKHTWLTAFRLMKSDIERYSYLQDKDRHSRLAGLRAFVLCQGLQASMVYRIGQKIYHPTSSNVLRYVSFVAYFMAQRWMEATTGISLNPRANIGKGFYIGHFGGIIIGKVTIGENCNISHEVTLGRGVANGENGVPTLGDRVWIGPGAKITGPIHLGDDCVVGANAVVLKSVPARALAVGIPAKIKPNRGSFDIVVYRGMEADESRTASMAMMKDLEIEPATTIDLDTLRNVRI
jgi:serine O-acetyltransferase